MKTARWLDVEGIVHVAPWNGDQAFCGAPRPWGARKNRLRETCMTCIGLNDGSDEYIEPCVRGKTADVVYIDEVSEF